MPGHNFQRALYLVNDLFKDHKRAFTGLPYTVHVDFIAAALASVTDDEDVLVAGLLHDVIEDIDPKVYSPQQLRKDYGQKIYDIVVCLSHDGTPESKQEYLDRLSTATEETVLVSAADMLHNVMDIIWAYEKYGQIAKDALGGEKAEQREWFYVDRYKKICQRLGTDHGLVIALKPQIKRLQEIHQEIM